MKILLLGSSFFGYLKRVSCELQKLNDVDEFYTYKESFKDRLIRKLHLNNGAHEAYYNQFILNNRERDYDIVLVMGGRFPDRFMRDLRKSHPKSRFILYLSADMYHYKFSDAYLRNFDKIFSYSLSDSEQYGFLYRPWFFSEKRRTIKDIDISFIGSIHRNRKKILYSCYNSGYFSVFYYIYSDRIAFIRHFYEWRSMMRYIKFNGLPYDKYIDMLSQSFATLDIPETNQNNITTRPIEAIATDTKIITTNKNIVNYDFYDPANVMIIGKTTEWSAVREWLKLPYKPISEEIISRYSIESWCNEVISL